MNNLTEISNGIKIIPSMSDLSIEKVRMIEEESLKLPQTNIQTSHTFHAGVYSRTIFIHSGIVLTGALIKIPTLIIISGCVIAYIGGESIEFTGYNVIPSSANRKQVFVTKTDTYLTMVFATKSTTIEEAEEEFTDEFDRLSSRNDDSINFVWGK